MHDVKHCLGIHSVWMAGKLFIVSSFVTVQSSLLSNGGLTDIAGNYASLLSMAAHFIFSSLLVSKVWYKFTEICKNI